MAFIDEIKKLNPDLICVVAYGKILPKELLDIPKMGCINVHGSLLPKYRGAAPIQWAVINGEQKTGITTTNVLNQYIHLSVFIDGIFKNPNLALGLFNTRINILKITTTVANICNNIVNISFEIQHEISIPKLKFSSTPLVPNTNLKTFLFTTLETNK